MYIHVNTPSSNQCVYDQIQDILCHQYGVFVAEWQMFLFAKHLPVAMSEEKVLYLQAG